MNQRQNNKLKMFSTLRAFLLEDLSIVDTLPNFSSYFSVFLKGVEKIKTLSSKQSMEKSGYYKLKKQLRDELVTITADTSRKLQAYARYTGNEVLKSETHYPESTLQRARNVTLQIYCSIIYKRTQENIQELEPYQITPQSQKAFLKARNAYADIVPETQIVRAINKRYTDDIAEVFKETSNALQDMDATMEIIRLSEPGYYLQYKRHRKIPNLGKRKLILEGKIIEAESKEPVKNATILFARKAKEGEYFEDKNFTLHKKSAKQGGFRIKSMPDGIYDVTANKFGYAEQKTTVAITKGELCRVVIELRGNY